MIMVSLWQESARGPASSITVRKRNAINRNLSRPSLLLSHQVPSLHAAHHYLNMPFFFVAGASVDINYHRSP